ncbi:hypothetical protein IV102_26765 [bacterium]|nr:hypothetical protein [bacterium]
MRRVDPEGRYACGHISGTPVCVAAFGRLVVYLYYAGGLSSSLEQAISLAGVGEFCDFGHCVRLKWLHPPSPEDLVRCLTDLGAALAAEPSPCHCGEFPVHYWFRSYEGGVMATCPTCRGLIEQRLPADQPHPAPFFGEIDWLRREQDGHRGRSGLHDLLVCCPLTGPLHKKRRQHLETSLWMPDRRTDRPVAPQFKVVVALAHLVARRIRSTSPTSGWPVAMVSGNCWPLLPTQIDHSCQVEFDGKTLCVGLPLLEVCTLSEVDFLIERAIHLAGLATWGLHRYGTGPCPYGVGLPLRRQLAIEGPRRDEAWLLQYPDPGLALRALGKQALLSALSFPARLAAQTEVAARGGEARDPLEVLRLGLGLLPPRLLVRVLETLCPLAQVSPARARQILGLEWPESWDWQPARPACLEIPQYGPIRRQLLEPTRHRLSAELTLLRRHLDPPHRPRHGVARAEQLLTVRRLDDARSLLSGLEDQSQLEVRLCWAELAYLERRGRDLSVCVQAILDGSEVAQETLVILVGLLEDLGEDQPALTVLSHLLPDPTLDDYVSSSAVRLHGKQRRVPTPSQLDPNWVAHRGGEVHSLTDGWAISGPFCGCDCLLVFKDRDWLFRFIVPAGVHLSVVAAAALGLFLEVDGAASVDSQSPFLTVTLTPGCLSDRLDRVQTVAYLLRRGGQFEPVCMVCQRAAPRLRVNLEGEVNLDRLCDRCLPAWQGVRAGVDCWPDLGWHRPRLLPPWHSPLVHHGDRNAYLEYLAWKRDHGSVGLIEGLQQTLASSRASIRASGASTERPGIGLEVEPVWNDWLMNELGQPIATRLDLSSDVEVERASGILRVGLLCLESMEQEELLALIKRSALRFRRESRFFPRAVDAAICRSLPATSLLRAACKQEVLRLGSREGCNTGLWLAVTEGPSRVDVVRLVLSGLNRLPTGFAARLLSGVDPGQRLGPARLLKLLGGTWPALNFSPIRPAFHQLLNYAGVRQRLTRSINDELGHDLTLRQAFVVAQRHRLPPLDEGQRQLVRHYYSSRPDLEGVCARAECAYFEGDGLELGRMTSQLLPWLSFAGVSGLAAMLEDLDQVELARTCWERVQQDLHGGQAAQAGWNLRRLKRLGSRR